MIISINKSNAEILKARLTCIKERAESLLPYIEGVKETLGECCESTCIAIFILSGELQGTYFVKYSGSFNGFPEYAGDGMDIKVVEENFRYYYEIRVGSTVVGRSAESLGFGITPITVSLWTGGIVANERININFCYGGEVPDPPEPPVNPCEWPTVIYLTSECEAYLFTSLQMTKVFFNRQGYFSWAYYNATNDLLLAYNSDEGRFELLLLSENLLIASSAVVDLEDVCDIPETFQFQVEECEDLNVDSSFCPAVTDLDAIAWIEDVEAADEEDLECQVKIAMEQLVLELKAANEWDNLDYLRVFAGPKTKEGAGVFAKGSGPNGYLDIVDSDYNRKKGITGDGLSKRINNPYFIGADTNNRQHNHQYWAYLSEINTLPDRSFNRIISIDSSAIQRSTQIYFENPTAGNPNNFVSISWSGSIDRTPTTIDETIRFVGLSRSSQASYSVRFKGVTQTIIRNATNTITSSTGTNSTFFGLNGNRSASTIFAQGGGAAWVGDGSAIETAIKNYLDTLALILP
jgi:hypothetical protein